MTNEIFLLYSKRIVSTSSFGFSSVDFFSSTIFSSFFFSGSFFLNGPNGIYNFILINQIGMWRIKISQIYSLNVYSFT